jgi:predicted choloylglycine hydrolase/nitrite reductase/ring-hydroxylating ferredoxin subunit
VRLPANFLHLPAARRDWAPSGILAYSKICPHAGCAISLYRYPTYAPTSQQPAFTCPCHYSTFLPGEGGRVIFGPAGRSLPQLPLLIDSDGKPARQMWPAYRAWYLRDGIDTRPDLATCRRRLSEHMPELVDTYELLVELAGGDELAARCLSLYCPPGFIVGCSQGIWTQGSPMLVRNYDYPPDRLEGVIIKTAWTGRQIVGMSDCLWGLLDGMNDAGLVVSLTFGGRRAVGEGFAIPLIVRYLLETCEAVTEARAALARLPVHAAQTLSLLDRRGEHLTAYLAPDRAPRFYDTPVTTNHQGDIDWPEYASAVRTVEREQHLLQTLERPEMTRERFIDTFLEPPLHNRDYASGMGTLYTRLLSRRGSGRVSLARPRLAAIDRGLQRGSARAVALRRPVGWLSMNPCARRHCGRASWVVASWFSSHCRRREPPTNVVGISTPRVTRWHGAMMGIGLAPMIQPRSRGEPAFGTSM